jgi:hypothetical protein
MVAKFNPDDVFLYVDDVFGADIHAKRVQSLASAVIGVLASESLAVAAIGQGLAHICGLKTKYAVKQIDRLVGNQNIAIWDYFDFWVPHVVAARREIVVALDWTDFDADGHATIALNLLTDHGRAIPLIWRTVEKASMKDNRNEYEDSVLLRLRETVPKEVEVTIVADRGFMDTGLMEVLRDYMQFGYIIRLRGNVTVTSAEGEKRKAAEWVGKSGQTRTLRNARLTTKGFVVPTIVCKHSKGMKEPWILAASDGEALSANLLKYYAKRWGIESYFRDTKDLRFGLGMDAIHTKSTDRRDRLFLLSAMAIMLLTLLGAACEQAGYDRYLKANTVKTRTHSLFRQGQMIYQLIPTMEERWLVAIMQAFREAIESHPALTKVFSSV